MSTPQEPQQCSYVSRRQFITRPGSIGFAGSGRWLRHRNVAQGSDGVHCQHDRQHHDHLGRRRPQQDRSVLRRNRRSSSSSRWAGGNDALSMVVPHANSSYYDMRPSIGISTRSTSMVRWACIPIWPGWRTDILPDSLALIEGVGCPDPDLSHFVSMETWWTAHASGPAASGWLGRYFDGTVGEEIPLAGVTIGPGPSRSMLGDSSFTVSIQDSTGLSPVAPWIDNIDELMGAWAGFAPAGIDSPGLLAPVRETIAYATQARGELASAINAATNMDLSGGSESMGGDAHDDDRHRQRPVDLGSPPTCSSLPSWSFPPSAQP